MRKITSPIRDRPAFLPGPASGPIGPIVFNGNSCPHCELCTHKNAATRNHDHDARDADMNIYTYVYVRVHASRAYNPAIEITAIDAATFGGEGRRPAAARPARRPGPRGPLGIPLGMACVCAYGTFVLFLALAPRTSSTPYLLMAICQFQLSKALTTSQVRRDHAPLICV